MLTTEVAKIVRYSQATLKATGLTIFLTLLGAGTQRLYTASVSHTHLACFESGGGRAFSPSSIVQSADTRTGSPILPQGHPSCACFGVRRRLPYLPDFCNTPGNQSPLCLDNAPVQPPSQFCRVACTASALVWCNREGCRRIFCSIRHSSQETEVRWSTSMAAPGSAALLTIPRNSTHTWRMRGFAVFAIDYRHAPEFRFPTQIQDVQTALPILVSARGRL